MSQLGQTRKSARSATKSALSLLADMPSADSYRRIAEEFTVITKSNFFDIRAMVRCEVDCL
jgi:hypothetical protein